jgi:cephalosporin hydroxylase
MREATATERALLDKYELTPPQQRQKVIDDYHRLWYDEAAKGLTWGSTTYMGVKLWKHPTDLYLYAELIHAIQPALLIETGTAFGGSALYFAHLMDQLGHGRVLSIDLSPVEKNYPRHPRINYLGGYSSTHIRSVREAGLMAFEAVKGQGAVMVILDSDHAERHVTQELRCYASLVTPSSYIVVEDTELNGHPIDLERGIGPPDGKGPGPYEAAAKWLPHHPEFVEDKRLPARMLWSAHTWLRRERT